MVRASRNTIEMAQSDQELVSDSKPSKWRKRVIAGGIVVVVVVLLVVGITLLASGEDEVLPSAQSLTLEDFLGGHLQPTRFNATWVTDDQLFYKDQDGNMVLYNVTAHTKTIVLPAIHPSLALGFLQELSPDQKYLLVPHSYIKQYRHTYRALYEVIDLSTSVATPVRINGVWDHLELVTWGSVGSQLAIVHHNDLYYRPEAISEASDVRITDSGIEGTIYNAVPDWVYEEEVISSNKAVWFSADGSRLAYATFNDTAVEVMRIPYYGHPGNLEFQYLRALPVRYPKPGTPNPTVVLTVVDLQSSQSGNLTKVEIKPPGALIDKEHILTAVTWATNESVVAVWMNRVQNNAYIEYCGAESGDCRTVRTATSTTGWVELFTPPIFNQDGSEMILMEPVDQGSSGSYRQVVLVDIPTGKATPLTKGESTVTEIITWDQERDFIYYLATNASDSGIVHLYRVASKSKVIQCVSCKTGTGLYHSADISKAGRYIVLSTLGPSVPQVNVFSAADFVLIGVWEDNSKIVDIISEKSIPRSVRLEVDLVNGFKAQVGLLLPPDMDTSGKTKYPMLVNVYGGPDSFQVIEKWSLDWGAYLAANRSIIHAVIDGRGSGLKGERMLHAGYRKLGTVEIWDQINVTRHLQEKLGYIDASRTAIWGWSYGGYATAMALAQDVSGVFKCGASVAPVTDWALYDSIYTERYMGLPTTKDNLEGYVHAQVFDKYENLRNKMFFLVHGTLDDNVHYQQAMMLARVLEQQDILFEQMSYSDEDHGLAGVRPHLYHSLERFFNRCFAKSS